MEVCVDCLESGINAVRGGAKRIELCSALSEGGLSPSVGLLRVLKKQIGIPVFCMIRPRDGDFLYTELELQIMEEDIKSLLKDCADGLVFGCLTAEGKVDDSSCSRLISLARKIKPGCELTFHRAVDLCDDIVEATETIKKLGFNRLLTSGGKQTAYLGQDIIRDLITKFDGDDFHVFPGGGVNEDNLGDLIKHTNAFEFHASARKAEESKMEYKNLECSLGTNSSEYTRKVTSVQLVSKLTTIYKEVKLLPYVSGK